MARFLGGASGILLILALLVPAALAAEVVSTSRQVLTEAPEADPAAPRLQHDIGGSSLFDLRLMGPGQSAERCVRVSLDAAGDVDLFLRGDVGGTGLAAYLDLTVEVGTGGGFGDCESFSPSERLFTGDLATFGGLEPGIRSALPESGELTYRLTVTLRPDPAAQGKTASLDLTWEARG